MQDLRVCERKFLLNFWPDLLGPGNTAYSSIGTEHAVFSSTGTEKSYPLTALLFLSPIRKTDSPLTPNDIDILQFVVKDYNGTLPFAACMFEVDIDRTFPDLRSFDELRQQSLLRVLNAYVGHLDES